MGIDIFQLPGILFKRWLYVLATMLVCTGLAAGYVTVKKPVYIATTDILIDPEGLSAQPGAPNQVSTGAQDQAALESQIYLMQSREILNEAVGKLNLTADRFLNPTAPADKELALVATVSALQKNMAAERAGTSLVIQLSVKHRDVARAAEIANTIAQVYLKKLHEARSDASVRASGAFEMQAQELADKLRRAEEQLEKFKAANGLVSTGQQGLVIDQQVEGVNKQLITARADLEVKRANYNQVKALTVGSVAAGAIPEALASTSLSAMRSRYAEVAAKANQLSTTLGANHPQMRAARAEVASMTTVMDQELARIRQSMKGAFDRSEANVAALQGRLDSLTASSLDTSEAGIRARALLSETEALRALYKTFLTRASELGERETVNLNNSRVISKAVPAGTSGLVTKLLILIAAALFGTALGCGVAVLRELAGRLFTGTVSNAPAAAAPEIDNAERPTAVPLPVIARIPMQARRKGLFQPKNAKPVFNAETDRQAQIGVARAVDMLLALPHDSGPTLILVLPAGDRVEENRIAADLADTLQRMKKTVLFSAGQPAEAAQPGIGADVPLGDVLAFTRLAAPEPRQPTRTTPTFSQFSGRNRKADYIIIDGGGPESRQHLAELLEKAHAILVLAGEKDGTAKIAGLVKSLAPWRDRMLGAIVVAEAA